MPQVILCNHLLFYNSICSQHIFSAFPLSQDFEKTGADAEILEGVAKTMPIDILAQLESI